MTYRPQISPSPPTGAVFCSMAIFCCSSSGLKFRATPSAWSRIRTESHPVNRHGDGHTHCIVQCFDSSDGIGLEDGAVANGFMPSTAMPCFCATGITFCPKLS